MLDCEGLELTTEDQEIIAHPLVGGVILFARNYDHPEQVTRLCQQIRSVKRQPVLISVDQEGGRVQRFKTGMTRLPAMDRLGLLYRQNAQQGLMAARETGWLLASELRVLGVDFSFAPVLDLDWGCSEVIGDRAFCADASIVSDLSDAFQSGVHSAGMATVGKHFPGHGAVAADSHTDIPVDERCLSDISDYDLVPFKSLIFSGLNAIMPAHVIYPNVDSAPAGFSGVWLQDILRKAMRFEGVIFSDDLSMEGARVAGDHASSARAALDAGCDMILVCNDRPAAIQVVDGLTGYKPSDLSNQRLLQMMGKQPVAQSLAALMQLSSWQQARAVVDQLVELS